MISEKVKKLVVKTGVTIVISASVIGFASSNLKPNYLSDIRETYAEERLPGTHITTNNLNLRRGAGTNYGILLTIPKGGKVEVLSTSGSWSKVNYKGTTGFVSSQYLKVTGKPVEKPETPPVETPSNGNG
ncbi:MAG: SH3 domain-containing protein, partial [Clostridium sp.]|nr:SH3 domain-containing protein [Clostridium sp.]